VFEALIIHILYEIMREAGLRLPKSIGHAVSIVGAIVIGDAAVSAGLASAPMVMVVALTAISAFSVPSLYEQVAVLKFIFIIVGGAFGLFGVTIMLAILFINICSVSNFGLPFTAPVSPFSAKAWRDVVVRMPWRYLGRKSMKIQNLKGSEIKE
ncbi:MAG: spore germination protein, partial [Oscillospiraceae bacterium]